MHPVIEHRAFSDNVESGLPQENALLNKWRIFCSQNRYPPSDQVRGHALAEYALRSAFDANGCPENNFSRSGVVRFHFAARPGRDSDPRQSGRTGRPVPRSVRARTRLGRTRRDRRTMPVGLHAGAEHGAERPHLRDASRDPRIPRRAVDRSARPDLCRAASIRTCSRSLSIRGARLDPPPRRLDIAPVAAARAGTRGDLSVLPMKPQPSIGCGLTPDRWIVRRAHLSVMPSACAPVVIFGALRTCAADRAPARRPISMSEIGVNLVTHLDTYHRFQVVIIDQSMWHLGSVGTFLPLAVT